MKNIYASLAIVILFLMVGCTLSQSNLQRGKNYLAKENYVKAIQELEKAANEEGDAGYYLDVYASLGDAYAQNGEPAKAVSVYRNAIQIIHLRTREIYAQRREVRQSLNMKSDVDVQHLQEEDMGLADEEWQLQELQEDLKSRIKNLTGAL
jgi:tetratricopeptide (TPR) repeat protein